VQALALVEQALALDPFHSWVCGVHLFVRYQACMALGRYDDAVAACEKTASLDEYSWFTYVYLVAAHTQQGDAAKAAAEKVKLCDSGPVFRSRISRRCDDDRAFRHFGSRPKRIFMLAFAGLVSLKIRMPC